MSLITNTATAALAVSMEPSRLKNASLWGVQFLLAALFLFAGGMKLAIPAETLASMGSPNQIPLPGLFIKFIGVVEVLGALGLVLPRLLRIKPQLTPLAAAGLLIVMIGAVGLTLASGEISSAAIPLVVGLLLLFVAKTLFRSQGVRG